LARVCGLTSFGALAISLLTGAALRTAVLDWLGSNRSLRSLHEYTAVLWIPLGVLHVGSLLLDHTARVGLLDLVVPFRMPYGALAPERKFAPKTVPPPALEQKASGLQRQHLLAQAVLRIEWRPQLAAFAVPALHGQVELRLLQPRQAPVGAQTAQGQHLHPGL